MSNNINNFNTPFHIASLFLLQPSSISTGSFFWYLEEKNIINQNNSRGKINKKYNSFLKKQGHKLGAIPGGKDIEKLGMDRSTEILYPALYAKAYRNVLGASENDYLYQWIESHLPIPSTGTFFYSLHKINLEYQANMRGLINQKYNELLQLQQRHTACIPGGEDLEVLGMDRLTQIFYPELYLQAYKIVIEKRIENDPIQLIISSFVTKRFTYSFFYLLHEKNLAHQENIRSFVYLKYNELLRENQCYLGLIPGEEDYESFGMNQSTELLYPELFAQAYKQILEAKENGKISDNLGNYVKLVIKNNYSEGIPKENQCGASSVCFPKSLPQIVIKKSKHSTPYDRHTHLHHAKKICEERHFTHLHVADAFVDGDYLIEQRIPIATTMIEQVAFYIEYREELTKAVTEFTEFCCLCEFSDLEGSTSFNKKLCSTPLGRYDNIPFFCKGIALLDLEHFYPRKEPIHKKNVFFVIDTMVSLFPLHFSEVVEVGKKYGLNTKKKLFQLEYSRNKIVKYFQTFEKYMIHLSECKITPADPEKLPEMSVERTQEIAALVLQEMEAPYFKDFYTIEPSKFKENFIYESENIIRKIYRRMGRAIRDNCEKQGNNILYMHQLIRARVVYGLGQDKKIIPEMRKLSIIKDKRKYLREMFAEALFSLFLQKMEGKEIFRFCPDSKTPMIFL